MIFAALLFWAFSVTAKDLPDEHKCFDPATTKASEVMACASNMRKTVEADLNEMYQDSVTQAMPPRMGASLQKTQRIWISYRDAVCKTQPAYKGEGGQFGVDLCIIKITRDRITDIDAFYIIRR